MQEPTKPFYLIFISLIISFITLAAIVTQYPLPNFDIQVSQFLQKNHSTFLDKIMLDISLFGELPWSLLLVVLIAAIFFVLKYRR